MPRFRITAIDLKRARSVPETFEEAFPAALDARRALAERGWNVMALTEMPEPGIARAGAPNAGTAQAGAGPAGANVPPRVDDADLYAFIGPNADVYLEAARRIADNGRKFHWPAFLVAPFWAFYRKLYLEGLALIVVPTLIAFVVPEASAASAAVAAAFGLFANRYYLGRARTKIAAIGALGLAPDARTAMIAASGGVSPASCVVAIAIGFAIGGAAGYTQVAYARLPTCGAHETLDLLEQLARRTGSTGSTGSIRISGIVELDGSAPREWRECTAALAAPSGERALAYRITWEDRAAMRFYVELH